MVVNGGALFKKTCIISFLFSFFLFVLGESDADDETNHHYEALYEVINPALMSMQASAASTSTSASIRLDHQDDSFDDSFDSDDAFEEVVVRGLVIKIYNFFKLLTNKLQILLDF